MIGPIFIFLGICLVIISTIGIVRFPDFYTRLHAVGIIDSSGAMLLLIGFAFALQNEFSINTVKIMLLILIVWIANSTNSYILACTYYKSKGKTKEG